MNKSILIGAASALALSTLALGAAAPAFAQDAVPTVGAYGNLGYSHLDPNGVNLNALGGRIGGRFWKYFGLEGEASFGVGDHSANIGGINGTTSMSHEIAGYAVGFLPVTPNFDILVRGGYGNTHLHSDFGGNSITRSVDSWNYGAGAQYFFTGHDGIRVDYTRNDYRDNMGHANVWGVSYVRKF
jgi:opacity protein-like surface antigen